MRRDDRTASVLSLIQMMAQTPQGSWQACPQFGLRDLFEHERQRFDLPRAVMDRINQAFSDLGLSEFVATEVVHEISANRDRDTYSIQLQNQLTTETVLTSVVHES